MINLTRAENNPIINISDVTPSREDFEVVGVFNAGAAKLGDETILLLRVAEAIKEQDNDSFRCPIYDVDKGEITTITFDRNDKSCDFSDTRVIRKGSKTYTTSISHLRVARSKDGFHFDIEKTPAVIGDNTHQTMGVEDPRIAQIGNKYYITYSAVSTCGIAVEMCETEDFITFKKAGNIFHPDNKDVAIFPEKIGDFYYALHRPSTGFGEMGMWLAKSPDLIFWGDHQHIVGLREGMWDSGRIGAGCTPIKTDEGWLELYHGAAGDDIYCMGAVLLDKDEPWKIIKRDCEPIMKPEADYEKNGFFGGVVFACGAVLDGDTINLYYGAADTCMCMAQLSLKEVLNSLK